LSNNLVREMLVGRVDLGGSFQACSASYSSTEDAMARSIVRLECEAEELRAEVALLREERNILARAKAAVTEGAEPSCNDSAQAFRERPEPSPHLSDTPETNALLKQSKIKGRNPDPWKLCRKLECESDELREQLYIAVEMLSTHPKFENKHPEEVWEIVKEAAK